MALRFEHKNTAIIHDFNFKSGDLVLLCNTAIEKALNWKMHPRYFGPMVIVLRNRGSAYIVCDLDSTLAHTPIAAFRIVPYFAHTNIDLPNLEQHIDMSVARLCELEDTTIADPNYPEMLENVCYFDSDAVKEPDTDADANNEANDMGSLELSREDETQAGTLYPFISDYDNMCIRKAYGSNRVPLSIYSRQVVLLP